ncbi:transient receptor potential protein-like [Ischnura elegans]|uniref:transient receptor potential protein-like n=1 Tax=Ischnura elegans TaxID=197161 RepID=UPI001ED87FF4|nr:transient receptor potential protein-like [Ischnura elegans]
MAGMSQSRENLIGGGGGSVGGAGGAPGAPKMTQEEYAKDMATRQREKRFLLFAERGDCATVRRLLDEAKENPEMLDINCVDPLNRSALIAAIENENIELIHILLDYGIKVKDALLHAIKEEYVEAVEILLEWEEKNHQPGTPYSWEAVDRSASNFTPDITPLILAAHMNNYEILKILLDRGATLPVPHDVRCGCDECVSSSETDSLRHSQSRINAYRALTSPSLISLSSRDPLLTAFELSWELRRLSRMETEFRLEYNEMRTSTQTFATSLLDHARTSFELETMLNHNPTGDAWEPGERQTLERLKMAIKYKQKQFVAHPNVQQLLAKIWYDGLPGFRRKSMFAQLVEVGKLGASFPVNSMCSLMAPDGEKAKFMQKPFVKFISHSSSYAFFLMLLGLASQRAEYLVIEWFGTAWMQTVLEDWKRRERGSLPGLVEWAVMSYVFSLIWSEVVTLWEDGLLEYIADLWNIVDWITNIFYTIWIMLRAVSWFIALREYWSGTNPWYPREEWDPFDPMLLSEGAFAAGMIFSFLKLVHIFSVNPHLGPLQISLGRMVIDILKFFFIYTLVLFAFGCGMNQLLWYYADLEKKRCYHLPSGLADFDNEELACAIWRRFANMFETSQSLFWASFGLVELTAFELTGVKSFTRFWALLMFGSYSVINVIVLLNMLIAMMSNSYQIISERSDTEWKFARSKLWMSYFEEGDKLPPPFNLMPGPATFGCRAPKKPRGSIMRKSRDAALERHDGVMTLLVRRYVTAEQRKRDEFGITEDDVMEIRQDISTLRYELIDILKSNGMKTPDVGGKETTLAGKKGRTMERRLLKDFQIGFVEGAVSEAITSGKEAKDVFSRIAKAIAKKKGSGKDWNAEVRRRTSRRDPIGSTNEMTMRRSQQSLRRHIIQNENTALSTMDQDKLVQYNPKVNVLPPAARVAYAKFKMPVIKHEYQATGEDEVGDDQVFKEGAEKAGTPKPRTSANASITSVASAIARPRPQSKRVPDEGQKPADAGTSKAPAKKPDSVVVDIEPKPGKGAPPPPPPRPAPPPAKEEPKVERKDAGARLEVEPGGKGKGPEVKRSPTPIPEEPPQTPAKEEKGPAPKKEDKALAPKKDEKAPPPKKEDKPPAKKEASKDASPGSSGDRTPKSSSSGQSASSTIPASDTAEPVKKSEPIKPGKSKVTGEVLSGWL